MIFAIIALGDERIGFLPAKAQQSGGMKMVKYVHCTVVKTRVCGQMSSEDAEPSEANPNPQREHLKNAYQMRVNCYSYGPATLDFRA